MATFSSVVRKVTAALPVTCASVATPDVLEPSWSIGATSKSTVPAWLALLLIGATVMVPPASVAAALAALDILAAAPDLGQAPLRKARLFTALMGLPDAQSAIVPLVLGSAEAALEASARLEQAGFLVVAIRPPTVPAGTARLRFAFCAGHADADIARLAAALREIDAVARREPCPACS